MSLPWSAGVMPVAALLVLSGCLSGAEKDPEAAPGAVAGLPPGATVAHYLDLPNLSARDESMDVFGSILEQYRTTAAGGVDLDTWVLRPATQEPVPLILEVTPYYGGGPPVFQTSLQNVGTFTNEIMQQFVSRGYAAGISSVRGTGNSGGCFTQGGPEEARDTAAVIEDLASKPWSNGAVGLIGVSYPGTTPQDVWVEAPRALKTIVPISGISDLYRYNFVNGVHINVQGFGFNSYYWPMVGLSPVGLALGTQVTDPVAVPGAVAGEACTDQVAVQEGGVSSTLDGNKDAYWQARDFHKELRDSWDRNAERASVFYVHGLQDWNVKPHMMEDWLPAIQESGVHFKAWLGQWPHAWPQRDDWWNATLVAWFDEFLKGVDTGILDAPRVQVQDDDGVWRHEEDWPPTNVTWGEWHPQADGTLGPEPGSGSASFYDYRGGLTNGYEDEGPGEVVWASAPLEEDLHVAGLPRFIANVTASGERASLVLTLAEGNESATRSFNFAAQSLNHVESLERGMEDVSGRTLPVDVEFFPQDDVAHKGNRLLLFASSNTAVGGPGPALQPVATGSTVTIDLAGARLLIPIDGSLLFEEPQPCWEKDEAGSEKARKCPVIR